MVPESLDESDVASLGESDVELEGEALVAGAQLLWLPCVLASATPANGPASAINPTETSRVAVPVARLTSPALCSLSQLLCRDRRKIATIPRELGLVAP